jgi:hypothetical protein
LIDNKIVKVSKGKTLRSELREATRRGEDTLRTEPPAATVTFNEKEGQIVIQLTTGGVLRFPISHFEELRNASPEEIAKVTLTPLGTGLHWDDLDAHYSVAGLIKSVCVGEPWPK